MPTSGEIWQYFMGRGINIGQWEERGLGSMAQHLESKMNTEGWSYAQAWDEIQSRMGEIQQAAGPIGPPTRGPGLPLQPYTGAPWASTPPAATPGDTAEMTSAKAIINQILQSWGLQGLQDWAYGQVTADTVFSEAKFLGELRQQDAYKQRFAGNEVRRQNGYNALAENEYLGVEDAMRELMVAADLPPGFYDSPEDFAAFIGKNVSTAEMAQRVVQGYTDAANADPAVKQMLREYYGIQESGLAAYFLDPNRATTALLRQYAAAKVGSTALRSQFGTITEGQAEMLAGLGISEQQGIEGFSSLAEQRQLFGGFNPYEENIDVDTQLAAAFRGDARAMERIRKRGRERLAQFQGGGGFAASREGLTLGSAAQ